MSDQTTIDKLSERALADYITSYEETIASLYQQDDDLLTADQRKSAQGQMESLQTSLDSLRQEWVRRMEAKWIDGTR